MAWPFNNHGANPPWAKNSAGNFGSNPFPPMMRGQTGQLQPSHSQSYSQSSSSTTQTTSTTQQTTQQAAQQPVAVLTPLLVLPQQERRLDPPTTALQQPQQAVMQAPPEPEYNITEVEEISQANYNFICTGGEARKQAAARGQQGLRAYEQQLTPMFRQVKCPANFPWYCCGSSGYLCGCGRHCVLYSDIDRYFARSDGLPQISSCNTGSDRLGTAAPYSFHPPPVDLWQPMHRQHREWIPFAVAEGAEFQDSRTGRWHARCLLCDMRY